MRFFRGDLVGFCGRESLVKCTGGKVSGDVNHTVPCAGV